MQKGHLFNNNAEKNPPYNLTEVSGMYNCQSKKKEKKKGNRRKCNKI